MVKKADLPQLQKQVAELSDALQRERADAINVRRRTEADKAKLGVFYKALVVQELLPAIDNLDRAIKHAPQDLVGHDYVKGVQGVVKQFDACLSKLGVERIKTVGEVFDPHLHEAIHMEDGEGNVEVVCEELQPGYRIGEEVIRHATVKVKKEKR